MAGRAVVIAPDPLALITSLRGLGYSPKSAVADICDNSISAGCELIEIDIAWNEGSPTAAILDDGDGIAESKFADALRLGGRGPSASRGHSDLGRFGMGLKTASLSQSRSLTVLTKPGLVVHSMNLDIDYIASHGWEACLVGTFPEHPFVARLVGRECGTLIMWDRIDELSGLFGLPKEAFFMKLEEIRAHLGMTFHRFISGDGRKLRIIFNGRPVAAWDPFQISHPATRELPSERVRYAGSSFTIKPYVLPHRDRFVNEAAYQTAGGAGGWAARQGFYVYRGKRLLVAGSWLGLGGTRNWTRDEASRLARIEIDLPVDLDTDWRIDVRKSQARPPGAVRNRLTAIAGRCRNEAREVFAFRGKGPRNTGALQQIPLIWVASQSSTGIRYCINRDHSAVLAIKKLSPNQRQFDALLSLIERSVPVERIWLDVSESEGSENGLVKSNDVEDLSDQLLELGDVLPDTMSRELRVTTLLSGLSGDLSSLKAALYRKMKEKS